MTDTKAAKLPPEYTDLFDEEDEDELALLVELLRKNTQNGILLFGQSTGVDIDYTLTNAEAAEWARKYAYEFIKGIDDTTKQVLQQVIAQFVETPGFTIGDVMGQLRDIGFGEDRALNIATTEITRAYSRGQDMAGEELKEQFPDVKIIDTWFTNNDDLVCELCAPLDGKEVEFGENFYEPENEYQDGKCPRHPKCRCWRETSTRLE